MRVLIFNQYALPAGEAGITRHGEIGAELVRRGHEVTVIASDFDYLSRRPTRRGGTSGTTTEDGVQFVWLRTGTYVGNDHRRVQSMVRYATLSTRSGLRTRPRPDVLVGSSPQPLAPLAASTVARVRRLPWVFEARDIWPSALVDMGVIARESRTHRVLARLERYLYADANAVVSVPPRASVRLEEVGVDPRKNVHIPNAASTLLAEPAPLPETLEHFLPPARSEFVVVYTGAVGVMQDFPTVLRAVSDLRDRYPALYQRLALVIVGGGVAATATAEQAAALHLDRVHVHPAVSKSVVRSILLRADACLLTLASADVFRYGISPNKLFDYFAASAPVLVASAHPTPVDDAGAGIRYLPGDSAALADAIAEMMDTPEHVRKAMGERGRRLIESEYSITAITDRYEALLERVRGVRANR